MSFAAQDDGIWRLSGGADYVETGWQCDEAWDLIDNEINFKLKTTTSEWNCISSKIVVSSAGKDYFSIVSGGTMEYTYSRSHSIQLYSDIIGYSTDIGNMPKISKKARNKTKDGWWISDSLYNSCVGFYVSSCSCGTELSYKAFEGCKYQYQYNYSEHGHPEHRTEIVRVSAYRTTLSTCSHSTVSYQPGNSWTSGRACPDRSVCAETLQGKIDVMYIHNGKTETASFNIRHQKRRCPAQYVKAGLDLNRDYRIDWN